MEWVTLENVNLFTDSVLKFAQVVAVFSVGIWAIYRFGIFRESVPRVNITHRISHRRLTANTIHVFVSVVFSNTGRVVWSLDSSHGWTRLLLIKPIEYEELAQLHRAFVIEETAPDYMWPVIDERSLALSAGFDIEPSDTEELHYQFVIPEPAETIEIISYYQSNTAKGLDARTVHDLTNLEGSGQEAIYNAE